MDGVLVGERCIEGREKVFKILTSWIIQLKDSETNTENEDPDSAAFVSDDLLYFQIDCRKDVGDLFLGAIDDELHVRDG